MYEEIANRAPGAMIIVMGYPRFFPSSPPGICYTGADPLLVPFSFSGPEMTWINGEAQKLDNQIQAAVAAAQQDGKNVRYVTGSYDAFNGHELCTADPYMNGVVNFNAATFSYDVSSFHPNLAGNQQLASLALATEQAVLIRVPNVAGLPATNALSAIRSAGLMPIEVSRADPTCNNIGYVIGQSPAAGVLIATGSPVTITVAGKPPTPCP